MTSTFAWLDYSERERRTMLGVIDLFREKGTVDELGLGVVRDAFADDFFPGTSTLHSRARYWLFVPWIYRRLESERTPTARADARARQLQADLVRALVAGGESEGVIGIDAREKLLRPPAVLYWAGLQRHGIRLVPGSIGRYHASLDHFHATAGPSRAEGDEREVVDLGHRNWHPALPEAPEDLFRRVDFHLRVEDATFLRERMITSAPQSLLAWTLTHPARLDRVDAPWQHPGLADAPAPLRHEVELARRFSLLMYGAVLVYNIALSDAARRAGLRDGSLEDMYRAQYARWVTERLDPELPVLRGWERADLWAAVERHASGRVDQARRFADAWMAAVLEAPRPAPDDPAVRALIVDRERRLKRSLARLQNRRALERWNGASGVYENTYRWAEGRTLAVDIADGLRARPHA